jgi:hypothetical protein
MATMSDTDIEAKYAGNSQGSQISKWETAVRGFGQGGTFGWGDELSGLTGAIFERLSPTDKRTFTENYANYRDSARRENDAAQQANPGTSIASNIAGSIPTLITGGAPIKAGAAMLEKAAPWLSKGLGKFGQSVVTNTAAGAIEGAGTATDNTGQGTETGTAVGAVLGVAGGTVGKVIGGVANKVLGKSAPYAVPDNIFSDSKTIGMAGQALKQTGNNVDKALGAVGTTLADYGVGYGFGYGVNAVGLNQVGGIPITPNEVGMLVAGGHGLPKIAGAIQDYGVSMARHISAENESANAVGLFQKKYPNDARSFGASGEALNPQTSALSQASRAIGSVVEAASPPGVLTTGAYALAPDVIKASTSTPSDAEIEAKYNQTQDAKDTAIEARYNQ